MKPSYIIDNFYAFFKIVLTVFLLFLLIRIYESMYLTFNGFENYSSNDVFFKGVIIDLIAIFSFGALIFPFLFIKKSGFAIANFLGFILLFLNLFLLNYTFINHQLLGSEICLFNGAEQIFIVLTGLFKLDFINLILVVLFVGAYFFLFYLSKRIKATFLFKIVCVTILIIFTGISLYSFDLDYLLPKRKKFVSKSEYFAVNNKVVYFISSLLKEKESLAQNNQHNCEVEIRRFKNLHSEFKIDDLKYPFEHSEPYSNVLGDFFISDSAIKPNIVFILVESLSRSFSGPNARFTSMTPFLDSLRMKSLYWENFVSSCDHTYGVLPNVLGSLPKSEGNFMSLVKYPNHSTIVDQLKEHKYYSSFYHGAWLGFNDMDKFVYFQDFDAVIEESKFNTTKFKSPRDQISKKFTWGYVDRDLIDQSLLMKKSQREPFMDVYLTISMHHPFEVSNDFTLNDAKERIKPITNEEALWLSKKPDVIRSIAYDDYVIEHYFNELMKSPTFKNTIFIITGDHNHYALPMRNELDAFFVPFMIYSPLITKSKSFKGVSTHRDIVPSVLALLEGNFNMHFNQKKSWLGSGLDTSKIFRSNVRQALSLGADNYLNYMSGKYLLDGEGNVFEFDSNFEISLIEDKAIVDRINQEAEDLKLIESYVLKNNLLLSK